LLFLILNQKVPKLIFVHSKRASQKASKWTVSAGEKANKKISPTVSRNLSLVAALKEKFLSKKSFKKLKL